MEKCSEKKRRDDGRCGCRAFFIYEFGWRPDDSMMPDLIEALEQRVDGLASKYIKGLFRRYSAGGLKPVRLLNLVVMYIKVPWFLVFDKPAFVVVRTTPPGIQIWTLWWASLWRIPVVCWLMDYHPEIEARWLEQRGWKRLAGFLRWIDFRAMRRFRLVVVLDEAMAGIARERGAEGRIIVHPTWGPVRCKEEGLRTNEVSVKRKGEPIRLCYAGNLGKAHDITTLEDVLSRVRTNRKIEFHVIGASSEGVDRFRGMTNKLGCSLSVYPRVGFDELGRLFAEIGADLGIVLLSSEAGGLVSPSKFLGYLCHGLPLLYVGPEGTNSDFACSICGAGWSLRNGASRAVIDQAANEISDVAKLREIAANARRAAAHFTQFSGQTLADRLESSIVQWCAARRSGIR